MNPLNNKVSLFVLNFITIFSIFECHGNMQDVDEVSFDYFESIIKCKYTFTLGMV